MWYVRKIILRATPCSRNVCVCLGRKGEWGDEKRCPGQGMLSSARAAGSQRGWLEFGVQPCRGNGTPGRLGGTSRPREAWALQHCCSGRFCGWRPEPEASILCSHASATRFQVIERLLVREIVRSSDGVHFKWKLTASWSFLQAEKRDSIDRGAVCPARMVRRYN